MAEQDQTAAQPGQDQPMPRVNVLSQFIRDMSFENIAAQKGKSGELAPDVAVNVNVDARKRPEENRYESSIKLNIEAKAKADGSPIFLLEIDYAGLFQIENVPDDQMPPFLLIECPRLIFPFLRRIVHDVTRDGGYPPLNLENIDFVAIYRAEIARRMAEANGDAKPN